METAIQNNIFSLAEHYLQTEKHKQAEIELRNLSGSLSGDDITRFQLLLGESLVGQNHFSEALDLFRQALQSAPDDKKVLDLLIHALLGKEETYAEGLILAESMLGKYPGELWYHYIMGHSLRAFSDDDHRVGQLLENCLVINPSHTLTNQLLFDVSFDRNIIDSCEDAVQVLMKIEPSAISTLTRIAQLEILKKNYRQALDLSRKAILISPDDENAIKIINAAHFRISKKLYNRLLNKIDDYFALPLDRYLNKQGHIGKKLAKSLALFVAFLKLVILFSKVGFAALILTTCFITAILEIPIFLVKCRTPVTSRIFSVLEKMFDD